MGQFPYSRETRGDIRKQNMRNKQDILAENIVDNHFGHENYNYQNNVVWQSAEQWGYSEEGCENPFQVGSLCWAIWHVGYYEGLQNV